MMRRTSHNKISARANQNMQRREQFVRMEKKFLALIGIVFISLFIILGSSIKTLANAHSTEPMNKYYTSIRIENGDTLWNIAKEYYTTVESIKEINGLKSDSIKAGDMLLIVKRIDSI